METAGVLEQVILFVSQGKVRNYSLKLKSTLSPHFTKQLFAWFSPQYGSGKKANLKANFF